MIRAGILPMPPPAPVRAPQALALATLAAPDYDGPAAPAGSSVIVDQNGPGAQPTAPAVDDWLNPTIRDVPHTGDMDGKGLFAMLPNRPPEGHQGYDLPDQDLIINRAHQVQALFASDWNTTMRTQQTGGHVVIVRIPPGSMVGYMPVETAQPNNARNAPGPWDAALVLGQV